eukprot:gnl/MRDRNA2_/MRDRNA2_27384_c0_seq1.p1 gnl/MRDRNA2_/MRDRNA2_27384_c0~~gnl/MRDRNA2_/MRDRNA2_27384_c0_seq1.p1  ORF type:complete len:501 (-),score=97.62 gnl/MRDRNA2_/MRDRNA2_27384_c0_seq1:225-1727(-)
MATADALRVQIAACKQQEEQLIAETRRAEQETNEAIERQKLRRELEMAQRALQGCQTRLRIEREYRQLVDSDEAGPHKSTVAASITKPKARSLTGEVVQGVVDCNAHNVTGEIEWSIKGFSWLKEALSQNDEEVAMSPPIHVAQHSFCLMYHPKKGDLGGYDQRCSLAINHIDLADDASDGVAFRYTIWIKSKGRGYVQWGERGNVCVTTSAEDMMFGPDVCDSPATPSGIFGMSHDQLVQSEWVIDDVLTAKVQVELRPELPLDWDSQAADTVSVPRSSFCDDFLPLLDTAAGSDVTFLVQGETMKAHSQILSARSEVLQRQFSCGMQETTSKEVTIPDCRPIIFRAFLQYLYCDSLAAMESFIASDACSSSLAGDTTSANGTKLSTLQQLLAVSHKYQVTRLQAWCELELCKLISIEAVCSVLLQAHLYDAKQLEKKCLEFVAANMNEVVKTEAFVSMNQHWPHVSLKIHLCVGRVSETSATTAMEVQENVRKRKRED